ncbi:MAG TPA: hypothetical protein VJ860_15925, partial [Polyangia bacterium]|nr:hypothetical protein [Polyangia bacterium]
PEGEVQIVLDAIRSRAIWAEAGTGYGILLPDPDDVPFAECAHALAVPLVTGNARHFPRTACPGVRILTPAQFVTSARTK